MKYVISKMGVEPSTGDNVLVYTKDNRKLDIVLTEADSKKQTITGRGTVLYKQNYSWRPLPVYEPSIDVNFSEIESIEIKEPEGGWPAPPNRWAEYGKAFWMVFCGPLCW